MTDRPNLMKPAHALADCDGRTQAAFMLLLATSTPVTVEGVCISVEDMEPTNNERFNAMLNGYGDPRRVYNTLAAFLREARP